MDNILIIKLGALGDVVMATPLIEAIVSHHRNDARCTLLTTPAFAPLFSAWPALEVEAIPRHGAGNFMAMLKFIRAGRYRRIYDLQGNTRSGYLCALAGVAERVGNHPRFPYTHHPAARWDGSSHIFTRMQAVLDSAGVTPPPPLPLLPATAATEALVRHWMEANALSTTRFVLLHAGASAARPAKRWPGFAALARALLAEGFAVVWLGGAADAALNRELAAHGGIDATDVFAVPALAELGRHAVFAVTNDSGPMHALAAAAIPVFGLFGPSDWRRNHALGQAEQVIACVEHVAGYTGARCGDCLAALTLETVWARLFAANLVAAQTPPA